MKILLVILTITASLFAGMANGQEFPATTLEDQFEKKHTVGPDDILILISFERAVSGTVNDFLNAQPKGFLAQHHTKYISDISGMPSLITRLFALPKMRNYNYPLMLNRDDDFKAKFDSREGKLTVYTLKNSIVESVQFIDPVTLPDLFKQ